jgi:c-di-GMP-binding flagellar brake protein YcgR
MIVLAKFTLSRQAGSLMASIRVIRTYERVSDLGVKTFRSGCEFVDLPERERDRLIKFVFQRERELRAKGAI